MVRESADLIYHLVVLWRESDIAPDDVWCEMRRGANKLGIAGKLPKTTGRYAPAPACGNAREETMSSATEFIASERRSAVLHEAHIGHLNGALDTIAYGDLPAHRLAR